VELEPIEAQNNIVIVLPIVVVPIKAQNNIRLPIVVEPIEVQNNIRLVIELVEAKSITDMSTVAKSNLIYPLG
jgi:Ca2+-dependent lipid-binding protein